MYFAEGLKEIKVEFFKHTNACWIWPEQALEPNQYVQFRHEFSTPTVNEKSFLYISTDTAYSLWINGNFIHCAQFHTWPGERMYDSLNIGEYLRPGRNVMCILSYYQGTNSQQYIKAEPGLIYALAADGKNIVSGVDTLYRLARGYRTTGLPQITPQLPFTFEFDGRCEDNWLSPDYFADLSWCKMRTKGNTLTGKILHMTARPVKNLRIKNRIPFRIAAQGIFVRRESSKSVAELMYNDFLSTRLPDEIFESSPSVNGAEPVIIKQVLDADGVYIMLDCGREEVGLFEIDIDCKEGTVIDITYGEHVDDLRVRSTIANRRFFANRYIAKTGRQIFTYYFTRFACRYIQLHISKMENRCILYYAGLRSVEYPIEIKGSFNSTCSLQNKIYDTAVRTLHLCMHEHYEDCAWREQALYANDSRNEALSGYYCFGDYEFPAASFELLGRGLKPDGFMELCAPADLSSTIPCYSMIWILALADHLRYSGSFTFARKLYPIACKMIVSWLSGLRDGLLASPTGPRYWHFYDWAPGLDGIVDNDCYHFDELTSVRYDAPLNLLLALALDSAAELSHYCGNPRNKTLFKTHSEALKAKIKTAFYEDKKNLFITYIGDKVDKYHYAQLTQALALLGGLCSGEQANLIRDELIEKKRQLVETTLGASLYKYETLLDAGSPFTEKAFAEINTNWSSMLFQGATSFWETLHGAQDFSLAGSLCHGWSAIPVYLYGAYILGIKPLTPGFAKFSVKPVGTTCPSYAGRVPTPSGPIDVSWFRHKEEFFGEIKFPSSIKPVISPDIESCIKIAMY